MDTMRRMKGKGFTLVELLVVILVSVLIMGAVLGLLYTFVFNYEESAEYSAARQRGQMAFALLSRPIVEAGLGIPNSETEFRSCFTDYLEDSSIPEEVVNDWDAPVYVRENSDGDESRDLYIVYSIPSGIANAEETYFSNGTSVTLNLTSTDFDGNYDWITFPSARAVFEVGSHSAGSYSIEAIPKESGTLPLFDELHYIRFLHARVKDGQLVIEDPVTGDSLGRVEGIEDAVFSCDLDDQIVTTYVLARGDVRHSDFITTGDIDGWPNNGDTSVPDDDEARHYRLSAHTSSWRVRN